MQKNSRIAPNADPDSGSRIGRTMRLVGCNLLTAAVLLVPIELGLRLVDFEFALTTPEADQLVDPDVLWVHPGYSDRVADARGTRPSIVFMGDSCTHWGRYDRDLRSIFTARNPDSAFTFVNVGTVGWSSWSGLRQLQRDVLPIRPTAITIYYGWNDHWRHFGLQDKDAARFYDEPSRLRTAQLVDKAVFGAMQLFADPQPYRVSLADFRANLRRMVRIARDNDIIPILITAPTSHRPGPEPIHLSNPWLTTLEDMLSLHRRYVQAVREVAAEEDAPLIDLHEEFNRLPRQDVDPLFMQDGIHLWRNGSRKIAEMIDRHLVRTNLYQQIVWEGKLHTEAEEHLQETLDDARLLIRGPFDVWLDGDRLLYVKDGRCDDSDEWFSLHVVPADPDDLPEHRKEYGFDNLDFDLSEARVNFMPRCVAAPALPDYPVSAIRTGQFQFVGENGFNQLWEGEFIFTEGHDRHLELDGFHGTTPGLHTEAEERLQETLDDARLLIRGPFDVWLDGDRLLYVKDGRCDDSDEWFSLHVDPADPDDLPEHRKEHGFENLDFDLLSARFEFMRDEGLASGYDIPSARLNFMPRCVAARALPDYPVAAIRTGQFQFAGENDFDQLWEGEFIFTEGGD